MTNKTQKQIIIDYLKTNKTATAREVSNDTGIARTSVAKSIADMHHLGFLKVVGENKVQYGTAKIYALADKNAKDNRSRHKYGEARRIVYNAIKEVGAQTYRDVSISTGLYPSTVAAAVRRLENEGFVRATNIYTRKAGEPLIYEISGTRTDDINDKVRATIRTTKQTVAAARANGGGVFGLMAAQLS